jgi:hypothetical protein
MQYYDCPKCNKEGGINGNKNRFQMPHFSETHNFFLKNVTKSWNAWLIEVGNSTYSKHHL